MPPALGSTNAHCPGTNGGLSRSLPKTYRPLTARLSGLQPWSDGTHRDFLRWIVAACTTSTRYLLMFLRFSHDCVHPTRVAYSAEAIVRSLCAYDDGISLPYFALSLVP